MERIEQSIDTINVEYILLYGEPTLTPSKGNIGAIVNLDMSKSILLLDVSKKSIKSELFDLGFRLEKSKVPQHYELKIPPMNRKFTHKHEYNIAVDNIIREELSKHYGSKIKSFIHHIVY
jgi:hypothetical protein